MVATAATTQPLPKADAGVIEPIETNDTTFGGQIKVLKCVTNSWSGYSQESFPAPLFEPMFPLSGFILNVERQTVQHMGPPSIQADGRLEVSGIPIEVKVTAHHYEDVTIGNVEGSIFGRFEVSISKDTQARLSFQFVPGDGEQLSANFALTSKGAQGERQTQFGKCTLVK